MRVAVFSHKPCWRSDQSPTGYATDGGFPFHIRALSELFDETVVLVPVSDACDTAAEAPLAGNNLRICPLSPVHGKRLIRKLWFALWAVANAPTLVREAARADAVHAAIPGDVGTLGIAAALAFRKPLFVRHCGNWTVQRTFAERMWRAFMERFAGKRNVMLATGGSDTPPSRNPNIAWIFSSSLSVKDLHAEPKLFRVGDPVRLVICCRQLRTKGTAEVIRALHRIVEHFPSTTLDIVGDGEALDYFRQLAAESPLSCRIIFHGKLPHREVLDLLSRSTLFCYPTQSEGFPKAVLEALAFGLPVVTTRVSVLPQLINRGCGTIVDDTGPEALASAVIACLDPAAYASMSKRAIETARQFSLERWRDVIGDHLRRAWGPLRETLV